MREQLLKKLGLLEMKRMRYFDSVEYCYDKAQNEYTSEREYNSGQSWEDAAQYWKKKERNVEAKIHKLVNKHGLEYAYKRMRELFSEPESKAKILGAKNNRALMRENIYENACDDISSR